MRFRLRAAALLPLLVLTFMAAVTVAATATAEEPAVDEPFATVERLDRATLVAAVLDRNRDLAAAVAAWRAAGERPVQASALPDPRLSYAVAPLSVAGGNRFGQSVELSQPWPYPGKLRLAGEAAEARAEAVGRRVEELRLDLAHLASDLFYDLHLVDRSREINSFHVELLEELKEVATTRYAAGLEAQQVPLQAEVELTHLVHRDVLLRSERQRLEARLNALLHRPPSAPLPPLAFAAAPEGVPELEHGESHASTFAAAALVAAALGERPEVAAAESEIEARRLERELAALERRPDFGFMATYSSMWREEAHRLMAGVSVSLPVRRARLAAIEAEADAELAAAEARREAVVDQVRSEVAVAADLLAEMVHVVDLYDSRLLPAAEDQLQAARSGFQTGQVSFLSVVEAEKNLRTVELGKATATIDRQRRRADLERALGIAPGAPLPSDLLAPETDHTTHHDTAPGGAR